MLAFVLRLKFIFSILLRVMVTVCNFYLESSWRRGFGSTYDLKDRIEEGDRQVPTCISSLVFASLLATGSASVQGSPAVSLLCHLTQTSTARNQGQNLIAWRPKIAGARIFAWHMVRSATGNRATAREGAVRNWSFQLTLNSCLTRSEVRPVRKQDTIH